MQRNIYWTVFTQERIPRVWEQNTGEAVHDGFFSVANEVNVGFFFLFREIPINRQGSVEQGHCHTCSNPLPLRILLDKYELLLPPLRLLYSHINQWCAPMG